MKKSRQFSLTYDNFRFLHRPREDPGNTPTSYWTVVEGVEICVVLTGFIGRIDNYSRRRLGVEVDARLAEVTKRFGATCQFA